MKADRIPVVFITFGFLSFAQACVFNIKPVPVVTEGLCSTVDRRNTTGDASTQPVSGNEMTSAELGEILRQVNAVRAAGNCTCPASDSSDATDHPPVQELSWNTLLEKAATVHSQDMVDNNFFSHTGSSGDSSGDRVGAQGYSWTYVNENIGGGHQSVTDLMDGLLNSGGHCRNIMTEKADEIGVSLVLGGASNTYSTYWTMNMARQ